MKRNIRNMIGSTPESRQSKDMFQLGRDAEIVNRTNYGSISNNITYSGQIFNQANRGYRVGNVLLDGRIFCIATPNHSYTKSIVYDPITNAAIDCLDEIQNLQLPWSTTLLQDGRVFIPPCGAVNGSAQARIYDPETNLIKTLPQVYPNYSYFGGQTLLDGRVFFTPLNTTALVLDVNSGVSFVPPMRYLYGAYSGTILLDGRYLTQDAASDKIFIWDSVNNTHETYTFPTGYGYSTGSCLLSDGRVFFPVYDVPNNLYRNIIYNWIDNSFFVTLPLPDPNYYTEGCFTLPDGRVFLNGYSEYNLIYDPIFDTYSSTNIHLTGGSYYITATILQDGRVILLPAYAPNSSGQIVFLGERLLKSLSNARVCAPFYNKW